MKNLLLALLFVGVSVFAVMRTLDHDRGQPEIDAISAGHGLTDDARGGRVFVLLVESLRARTALNLDLMPYLVGLGQRGFTAELMTVDEASSPGPLMAAFTGRDDLQGLGTMRMFVEPPRPRSSLFTQLKAAGHATVLYTDQWSFAPFHQDLSQRLPQRTLAGSEMDAQLAQLQEAKARFVAGTDRLVLYHLTILDSAAHRFGVSQREYRDVAQRIDVVIQDLDKSIPPQDHLVVMGDHGHAESGRHTPGLDVPTVFIARGPVFSAGATKTVIPMRAVRALLSQALGIPLSSNDAQTGLWNPWNSQDTQIGAANFRHISDQGVSSIDRVVRHFTVALLVAILFCGIWWLSQWQRVSRAAKLTRRRAAFFAGVLSLAAFGFGLGAWMSHDGTLSHPLPDYVLNQVWALLLLIGAVGIWRKKWSAAQYGTWVFGIPFLVLYPTVLSLGAPGVFAPSWILLGALQAIETLAYAPNIKGVLRYRRQTLYWAVFLALCLQPYFHVESADFTAIQFGPLIHEVVPTSLYPRSIIAGIVTWLIVFRRGQGAANKILAIVMALYVMLLQTRIIPENHGGCLAFGLSLLGLAYASLRGPRFGRVELDSQGFARTVFLCALLVLTFYLIRIGHESRTDLLLVFTATRYSALLSVRASRTVQDLERAGMLVVFLGVVGVGWMTLVWGLARIEWGVLYDFVAPDLVGRRIGHFYPLIFLRYVIPVMIVRLLVTEVLRGKTSLPRRMMTLAIGLKYVVSLAILLGVAATAGSSPLYVGVLSHIAVFSLLCIGLL